MIQDEDKQINDIYIYLQPFLFFFSNILFTNKFQGLIQKFDDHNE